MLCPLVLLRWLLLADCDDIVAWPGSCIQIDALRHTRHCHVAAGRAVRSRPPRVCSSSAASIPAASTTGCCCKALPAATSASNTPPHVAGRTRVRVPPCIPEFQSAQSRAREEREAGPTHLHALVQVRLDTDELVRLLLDDFGPYGRPEVATGRRHPGRTGGAAHARVRREGRSTEDRIARRRCSCRGAGSAAPARSLAARQPRRCAPPSSLSRPTCTHGRGRRRWHCRRLFSATAGRPPPLFAPSCCRRILQSHWCHKHSPSALCPAA